jgi:MoaA/NifB/PqqE/SkfB family radical SAM enzyme
MKPEIKSARKYMNLASFMRPFLDYNIRGNILPVLAGYKITHRCNLKCIHCPYWGRSGLEQDFKGVVSTLEHLRDMGVKILIIEGGEPLLWRDAAKDIGDVIQHARKLFPCVCITTNGTQNWGHLPLDRVWVSLDGPPTVNDAIRGSGVFDKVWTNLENQGKGRAFVSTTISNCNLDSVPEMLSLLRGTVAGVTIQFYYPYSGLPDPLFVSHAERVRILDELVRMKKAGYPVANSSTSLKQLRERRWTCEDRLLANAEPDGTILHGCYLKNRGPSECSLCGFTAHNEISLAFKGYWDSIRSGVRIFFS